MTARTMTLLLGGARSGKSRLAVELASETARPVTYVATSPRIEGDGDLDDRIAAHRAERPAHWRTVEEQLDLDAALDAAGDDVVVIDCLTLWTSNAIWHGHDDAHVVDVAAQHALRASGRGAATIVISNEVGLGVHPSTAAGRHFRDLLGTVNQVWARAAHRTLLLVAGRALALGDPRELLR
jgi:adenosyl cobinamide kinase/adenosyl cobinamide phosphate guanylyltransferase